MPNPFIGAPAGAVWGWDTSTGLWLPIGVGARIVDPNTGEEYAPLLAQIANANPNGQAVMANSSPIAIASDQSPIPVKGNTLQTLFSQTGVDVHANGNSGAIAVPSGIVTVSFLIVLQTLVGGTSPTVTFEVDFLQGSDIIFGVVTSSALNAAGANTIRTVGAYGNSQHVLPASIRVAWTTAGGPTSATADIFVIGR